jgi:hypothetical protein
MMNKFLVPNKVWLAAIAALSLATPIAMSADYLAESVKIIGACGKLFEIDSNAAGLTAQERAAIIQKNLDYAIVHAQRRTPSAVQVIVVNRNPVVTLDGFHIATADGNSAARHNVSQMQLAQEWADSIKFCLADAAAINKYLAMLTGNFPAVVAETKSQTIAYAPAGMFLPVKLTTPIASNTCQLGDSIQAVLSTDVPLKTSAEGTMYEAYLPAGSLLVGHVVDASTPYFGRDALSVKFHEIRTPDGEIIPINAHILGGENAWSMVHALPQTASCAVETAFRPSGAAKLVAAKGSICGGWVGNEISAGLGVPYDKFVLTSRAYTSAPAGEEMLVQLTAPSEIAVCSSCASTM